MLPFDIIGTKKGNYELAEVGEKFGPYTYTADEFSVKLFSFAQDDYNRWSYSDDNPFGKRIVQAAFFNNDMLHIFFTHYDPTDIFALHTQEELWYHSPAYVGENVTISGEYVDKYTKRGKNYIELKTKVTGEDGRVIAEHHGAEITKITGDQLASGEKKKVQPAEGERVTGEVDPAAVPAAHAALDLAKGTPTAVLVKKTTTYQTQAFSWGGMPFETIHSSISLAKKAGYKGLLVQGQQMVSYITELLADFFGESFYSSGHIKVKIIKPTLAGETLSIQGQLREIIKEDDGYRAYMHVWVKDSSGAMTVCGWADSLIASGEL